MPLAVVYAGTPEFAVPGLEAIAGAGHQLLAVYTQPDRPAGRGRVLTESPVKRRARELGLAVHQPATLRDAAATATLAALAPDVMVVAAYGLLLPPAILAIPRLGCVNIHASLLPRWRGAAPVQRALIAGDAETGISIMRMEAGLDTGAVYKSERLAIEPGETAAGLTMRLAALGARLIVAALADLEAGRAAAIPQATAGITYAAKLTKHEALLDWSRPAEELERRVRAYLPWPVAETTFRGAQLKVHAAELGPLTPGAAPGTIVSADARGVVVATGAGQLRLTRVQGAGRGVVSAAQFAAAAARHAPLAGERLGG